MRALVSTAVGVAVAEKVDAATKSVTVRVGAMIVGGVAVCIAAGAWLVEREGDNDQKVTNAMKDALDQKVVALTTDLGAKVEKISSSVEAATSAVSESRAVAIITRARTRVDRLQQRLDALEAERDRSVILLRDGYLGVWVFGSRVESVTPESTYVLFTPDGRPVSTAADPPNGTALIGNRVKNSDDAKKHRACVDAAMGAMRSLRESFGTIMGDAETFKKFDLAEARAAFALEKKQLAADRVSRLDDELLDIEGTRAAIYTRCESARVDLIGHVNRIERLLR